MSITSTGRQMPKTPPPILRPSEAELVLVDAILPVELATSAVEDTPALEGVLIAFAVVTAFVEDVVAPGV